MVLCDLQNFHTVSFGLVRGKDVDDDVVGRLYFRRCSVVNGDDVNVPGVPDVPLDLGGRFEAKCNLEAWPVVSDAGALSVPATAVGENG